MTMKKILCFGDIILDQYIYGSVSRLSPEAPIPILKQTKRVWTLGGSANVVRNLSALECPVVCFGVVDTTFSGHKVKELLTHLPFTEDELIQTDLWHTPVKTRLVAQGQQLLRLDDETSTHLTSDQEKEVLSRLEKHLDKTAIIILSDYDKGFLTPSLCHAIIHCAKKYDVPVLIDPKGINYDKYKGAYLISPNLGELQKAVNQTLHGHDAIQQAALSLQEHYSLSHVLVTLSENGMMLTGLDDAPNGLHIPAQAKDVYDVSGAGDTVMAVLAMALKDKKNLEDAAKLANRAGGIVVGKVGTAVVYQHELSLHHGEDLKIHSLPSLLDQVAKWRLKGCKIGFTNGCFDLLHLGHLHLLRQSKKECDKLIVAVNSDSSVKALKGDSRPIQQEHVRAEVLAALDVVDAVVLFSQSTPLELIQAILPNVLIKGSDYTVDTVVGATDVIHAGGRVFLASLIDGQSTTNSLRKIKGS